MTGGHLNAAGHFAEAERLLYEMHKYGEPAVRAEMIARAQVHATLALFRPVAEVHELPVTRETANTTTAEKPWLSIKNLAERLDVPVSTVWKLRADRSGPRGVRVGKHLRFALSDVIAWEQARRESPFHAER